MRAELFPSSSKAVSAPKNTRLCMKHPLLRCSLRQFLSFSGPQPAPSTIQMPPFEAGAVFSVVFCGSPKGGGLAECQGGTAGLAGDLLLKSLVPTFLPFRKSEELILNCMKSLFSDVVSFKNFYS